MPTPLSSGSAYATGADLVVYHDSRMIGDYVSDTGTPVAAASVPGNAVVLAALKRASGEVEGACLPGGRYTPTDLAALTGVSKEMLVGLVCDLAHWHLWKRRYPKSDKAEVPGAEDAYDTLALLRVGERIFGLQEVADAALPGTADLSVQVTGGREPVSQTAVAFFGSRGR